MDTLATGLTFNSYPELCDFIETYEEQTHCILYKSDSRTIAARRKRQPERVFNEELIYFRIL